MPGKHALLSASGAKRWMNCPGSIALEALFPEEQSPYAAEGTLAHDLASRKLGAFLGPVEGPGRLTDEERAKFPDMEDNVNQYVDFCVDLITNTRLEHADTVAFIEELLDYSKYVPEGFGTGDFIQLAGDTLTIVDYKHGKGVAINAKDTPQMRLYALGALQLYGNLYPIETIDTYIYQPRIESVTHESISRETLETWGEKVVKPAAKRALEGGPCVPGEWCRFCRARAICKARAEYLTGHVNSLTAKSDFE